MSQQRAEPTAESSRSPHTVSLKVLRLSRPSLAYQRPLPLPTPSDDFPISPKASLAYPDGAPSDPFILSPVLELPAAFGSAFVGETFTCTLCANNELAASDAGRAVSGVRVAADMQTPSHPAGVALELGGAGEGPQGAALRPQESTQKMVRFELKEEGSHILAVTVTYTETRLGAEGGAAGGRVRSFRKLYQFVAQQQLVVRTKVGELAAARAGAARFVLEVQLENAGENTVCVETVRIDPKPPLESTSLDWDGREPGDRPAHSSILNPRDVVQAAFVLEQREGAPEAERPATKYQLSGDKVELGQLSVRWRGAMGDRGSLTTGWLTTRRR